MPEYVVDLITGERKPYNPAPEQKQDNYGMESLNPRWTEQLFREQKPDVALKAIEAAIQFQGLRGYQQALKNGEAADKAMARYGPMIFRKTPQALGSSLKALTPPAMTPYQASQAALAREKFNHAKTNPPPVQVGGGLYQVNPKTGKYEALIAPPEKTMTETIPASPGQAAIQASPAIKRSFLGIDALAKDQPAVEGRPEMPPHGVLRVPRAIPPELQSPQRAAPATASTNAPKLSVGEVRKGYRYKGGNPASKESWEKVQ